MSNERDPLVMDMEEESELARHMAILNINRRTNPMQPAQNVEHRMIEEIDQIIGRYISRPDWYSPYHSTFEWVTEGRYVPSYKVILVLKEPAPR